MIRAEVFVFGSSPELLEGRRLSFVSKSSEPVVYCKKLERLCVGSCSDFFIRLESEFFQKDVRKYLRIVKVVWIWRWLNMSSDEWRYNTIWSLIISYNQRMLLTSCWWMRITIGHWIWGPWKSLPSFVCSFWFRWEPTTTTLKTSSSYNLFDLLIHNSL